MATGTWALDWVTGDIPSAAEFRKSMGCVADSTLGAPAASFDFTGLPTTYAQMLIVAYLRGDTAATSTSVLLRVNNDSTANYNYNALNTSSDAASAVSAGNGVTSWTVGNMPANTAPANSFGDVDGYILNYGNAANYKVWRGNWYDRFGTGANTQQVCIVAGDFRAATTAISRITLIPGAGNFVAGSRCSIYVMGS